MSQNSHVSLRSKFHILMTSGLAVSLIPDGFNVLKHRAEVISACYKVRDIRSYHKALWADTTYGLKGRKLLITKGRVWYAPGREITLEDQDVVLCISLPDIDLAAKSAPVYQPLTLIQEKYVNEFARLFT